jgi:hypothetical protein
MFASQAQSRVMQIHYQLVTSKKGNSSITKYFQFIKAMSDDLAVARHHLNDFESVSYLLAGLGSEYDPLVTSVTTRLDPLSLDELYGHLLAHEMMIKHHISSNEPTLPTTHFSAWAPMPRGRGSSFGGRNSYGGRGSPSNGHGYGSYFSQDLASPSRPICQLCEKIGHIAPRCYQRPNPTLAAPNPQAYFSSPSLPSKENWYPDTGATHHITNDLQNLNLSLEEYTGQDQIHIGNGTCLSIKYSGSASLSISRHKFLLNHLLHVPLICRNLLSVCQFALDNSVFFEFYPSHFVIKNC